MTVLDIPSAALALILILTTLDHQPRVLALGSASTVAVVSSTRTVCGILAGHPAAQTIQCFHNNRTLQVQPNTTFESISGGNTFFCGLLSGGFSLICWDTDTNANFKPKRLYYSKTAPLSDLTVGDDQVCAVEIKSAVARCWRGGEHFPAPKASRKFRALTSGSGFTCGLQEANSRGISCWGLSPWATVIESQFRNSSMSTLVAGSSHACGITLAGALNCRGSNDHGQLDVPFSTAFAFSNFALGADFSCAVRQRNGYATCWGGKTNWFEYDSTSIEGLSFETIESGSDFVCGLITGNLTVVCWGPGWTNGSVRAIGLPLEMVLPGPCVDSCNRCGPYPNSNTLCGGRGIICSECQIELPFAVPLPPLNTPSPPSQAPQMASPQVKTPLSKLSLSFVIVGSVGIFMGICAIVYCFRADFFYHLCRVRMIDTRSDPIPNPIPESVVNCTATPGSNIGSSMLLFEKGYWSGSSSTKPMERPENFSLTELSKATNGFSLDNKIGGGSFGVVYRGKLLDGREVAIKRGKSTSKTTKFQEQESAFLSELTLLTRLHHKHLMGLVGFCHEEDERLIVYEYMSNGSLHDHLHGKGNVEKKNSALSTWQVRMKVALDAARGIQYLHNYAVPPIIHRDIKSSNILLDSSWTARVSDFGLSLMGSNLDQAMSKPVGTVGYIDPEYYVTDVLTPKSDVYGFGVVLLELLTGKRAVFKNEGTDPIGVVEYAVPKILAGELNAVLDRRVGLLPPVGSSESKAVELVGKIALCCVGLESRERPGMNEIVSELEKALALCQDN